MTIRQKSILNIAERVAVTFVEGFMATWSLSNFAISKVTLYGAVAAGLSLVWNTSSLVKLVLTVDKPQTQIEPTALVSPTVIKPGLNIPVN